MPNAFLGAAAFATLYGVLQLGPIAVVSPVLASYAVVPVLLSVVLLGETLGGGGVAGVVVTIAGAALTSTDPRLRAGPFKPRGPAVGDRVDVAVRRRHLRHGLGGQGGRVPRVALVRRVTMTSSSSSLHSCCGCGRTGAARFPTTLPSMLRLAVLVGVMELVGTMVYARGAEVGLVSIVTAASATYPLIPCWAASSSCTSAGPDPVRLGGRSSSRACAARVA